MLRAMKKIILRLFCIAKRHLGPVERKQPWMFLINPYQVLPSASVVHGHKQKWVRSQQSKLWECFAISCYPAEISPRPFISCSVSSLPD